MAELRRAPPSSHPEQWKRFSELLARLELGQGRNLSLTDKVELMRLFRMVQADLALARQQGADPDLIDYLNRLLVRAYPVLMPPPPLTLPSPARLLTLFAARLLAIRGYLLLAALILLAGAALGAYQYLFLPDYHPPFISAEVVGSYETQLRVAREQGIESGPELRLAAAIQPGEMWAASQMIMWNNIRVALVVFGVGLLLGALTYLIVFVNGYLVGTLAAVYFTQGYGGYFIAGVAPHGLVELTVIAFAAGAGIALGNAWLFPGELPRLEALRQRARQLLPVVVGSVLILVPTGLVEGFVTPLRIEALSTELLFALKTLFGIVYLALVWFLILWAYRRAAAEEASRE